jgi:TolB protein
MKCIPAAFAAFAALCTLRPSLAAQDTTRVEGVRIGLTYSAGTKPGVLILPVSGANADSVRAIIQRDLDFGDRVLMIPTDSGDAPTGALNYALYAKLGAIAVVQASVTPGGALHIVLHDIASARVANVRDFPLPAPALVPAWRLAVHSASDDVEQWVTASRGTAATRILYVRDSHIWTVDSDGANAQPLAGLGGALAQLSPSWHPTGRYIAYCDMQNDGTHIVIRDLVAGSSRRISTGRGSNITPRWSPDGTTLVFASGEDGTDLYAASPFSGDPLRRVTVGRGSANTSPSFSPDGRQIAFTSGRLGHPEVYITDADGSNADLLTTTGYGDKLYRSDPDWSPDGRRVAFSSQSNDQFQVMTVNVRDHSTQALTSEGRNENPSWAPDGRHIVFTSSRTGSKQLWVLDTETYRTRQLTHGGGARQAAWSPRLDSTH